MAFKKVTKILSLPVIRLNSYWHRWSWTEPILLSLLLSCGGARGAHSFYCSRPLKHCETQPKLFIGRLKRKPESQFLISSKTLIRHFLLSLRHRHLASLCSSVPKSLPVCSLSICQRLERQERKKNVVPSGRTHEKTASRTMRQSTLANTAVRLSKQEPPHPSPWL